MKRALTGAILIHASAILFAAVVLKGYLPWEFASYAGSIIGLIGLYALITAAIYKDIDPKD